MKGRYILARVRGYEVHGYYIKQGLR